MRKFVLSTTAVIALVAPAQAADLPAKATPAAAYSWNGCYIGVNAGAIRGRDRIGLVPSGLYSTAAAVAAPPNAFGTGLLPGDFLTASKTYRLDETAATAGVQYGCNFQSGRFVAGLESDLNWSGIDDRIVASYAATPSENPLFTVSPQTDTVTTKLQWYSTSRFRFGWLAQERLLIYGTWGLAIARFNSTTNVTFSTAGASPVLANAVHIGAGSQWRPGLAAGGGFEYAFGNNWSVKAEYLYLHFGSWSYTSPLVAPAGVAAGYSWSTRYEPREHIARIGLNYRLGGPVIAPWGGL